MHHLTSIGRNKKKNTKFKFPPNWFTLPTPKTKEKIPIPPHAQVIQLYLLPRDNWQSRSSRTRYGKPSGSGGGDPERIGHVHGAAGRAGFSRDRISPRDALKGHFRRAARKPIGPFAPRSARVFCCGIDAARRWRSQAEGALLLPNGTSKGAGIFRCSLFLFLLGSVMRTGLLFCWVSRWWQGLIVAENVDGGRRWTGLSDDSQLHFDYRLRFECFLRCILFRG